MPDDIRIEQFRLEERDELLSFLALAYPDDPRKADPAFWAWHYLENPHTDIGDIPLWVVADGDRIVGQLATIPVDLKVGGEKRRSIWILDFVVLPGYRGRGHGKQLVRVAGAQYSTMLTLGINEQSTAVFKSLGWVALGGVNRYQRILFPGRALGKAVPFAFAAVADTLYSPLRPKPGRVSALADREIKPVKPFDETFQELWGRAAGQWPCAVVRSPEYLSWQFEQQPGKQFHTLGLYTKGRLDGYIVLFLRKEPGRPHSPKAAISDICYGPDDAEAVIDGLLNAAVDIALEEHVGSLVTDVLDQRVERRLRHFGFWRIKRSPRLMAYTTTNDDIIYGPANWFLTRGDSDVSIFEEPNL